MSLKVIVLVGCAIVLLAVLVVAENLHHTTAGASSLHPQQATMPSPNSENAVAGALSVTIDPSSLSKSSPNPTITGTILNLPHEIGALGIEIIGGSTTPTRIYEGPGSIRNQVWGSASDNPGFSIVGDRWFATVDYRVHEPVLQPGIYTVAMYSGAYLLTYDIRTVH